MIGQFLLTFREVLEAALITSIILAYLARTDRKYLSGFVWLGVSLATALSLVLGLFVWLTYGALTHPTQILFEGLAAILAVAVLTSMILWLATKGREIRGDIETRVASLTRSRAKLALASFSFIIVFREGLETVLFLTPFIASDSSGTAIGALLGLSASLALSYVIFVVGMRIDLRRFFYFTSILLVLLAGGLAGYGVHELIEYAELSGAYLGWFGEYAYELPIPTDSFLHHRGLLGSVFAVVFGYSVSAEWGRLLFHFAYLAAVFPLVIRAYRKK